MKVNFKNLTVDVMARNRGIELEVYDDEGTHLGEVVITRTDLTWCKGKTRPENGKTLSWPDVVKCAEKLGSAP